MVDAYLGEIRMFGGYYEPQNWAFCNGQLLAIAQYQALYSLLGTAYGGDGRTNFGLPDLRGRIPISKGQFPGSQFNYQLGQKGGVEKVTLTTDNLPAHTHKVMANDNTQDATGPSNAFFGATSGSDPDLSVYDDPNSVVQLNEGVLESSGGSVPLDNMQPYLCINFIIALQGSYPERS